MKLKSVKYKDSRIYVNLERSQKERDGRDAGAFLREFRNVYVVYKIKAFDRQVRDTILIKKKDLSVAGSEIVLKFELNRLNSPDDCQIEISTLKFNFRGDKSELHSINETFNFRDIRAIAPFGSGKKELRRNKNKAQKIKTIYVLEESYFTRNKGSKPSNRSASSKLSRRSESLKPAKKSKPDIGIDTNIVDEEILNTDFDTDPGLDTDIDIVDPDLDKLKELPSKQKKELEEQTIRPKKRSLAAINIEETTSISTVVAEVESNVQSKLDLKTMKLGMDIKQLCYGTFDLLLSNIPLPEFSNEHRASNAMVSSIHRYINAELLQNELEGGESA